MSIEKIEEFAESGEKHLNNLDVKQGFQQAEKPERQWFNYLLNDFSKKINQVIDGLSDIDFEFDGFAPKISELESNYTEISSELTRVSDDFKSADAVLQGQIDGIGGGKFAYTTYAKMEAAAALPDEDPLKLPANSSIDVTNDTDPLKNGAYSYDGAVFAKSAYDPLTQAKSYTDTAKSSAISTAADDATTKANTAKSEAISASATDATTKANTAKSEAINAAVAYTDEKINKIDLATPVLTGQEIYDKALIDNSKLFSAVWSEYNKPVWHIGSGVFVDAVGAKIKPVVEELVFTLKATQVNQAFYFPSSLLDGESFTVDWGDGSSSTVTRLKTRHDYVCDIGDEFVVRATGQVNDFTFANPAVVAESNYMLKSIDKNTLPKTTRAIGLRDCINLTSVCSGAFSSYTGTSLNLQLLKRCPSLVLNKNMFLGLSQVTNIDELLAPNGTSINATIPQGLLDVFINVVSAQYLFTGLTSSVPDGILDKLTNLENAYRMFYYATLTSSINPNLFKNQEKLKNVGGCFQSCKAVSDAAILYTDMARGNPTTTASCFALATNMTNLAAVPTGWK